MPFYNGARASFFSGVRPGAITNINTLPNLQVWYDGSDITQFNPTNPSSGTGITQWKDKSAFAHNASPSGGSSVRPTYQTNVQNGLSVVRFDGSNDNLTINPATWAASLSGFTTFVVAKITNTTGTRTIIGTDQNGQKIYWNGTNFAVSVAGGIGTSTATADTTKFKIFGLIYNGTLTGNASRLVFRYGETNQTLTFTGTVGATSNASTSQIDLGWYSTGNSEYFAGDIAEVIYFSRTLNSGEIAGVEDYLSNKWAI